MAKNKPKITPPDPDVARLQREELERAGISPQEAAKTPPWGMGQPRVAPDNPLRRKKRR